MRTLKACQDDNAQLKKQKIDIQTKMSDLDLMLTVTKENNGQLKKQLQALSAISSAQAESIKKSIDNINSKDDYLQTLQMAVSRRDSTNLAVLIELKSAMGSLGDDVHIKVQKGLVNVDFADKLLFSSDSNSYTFGDKAKQAVGRLARVLNDHPEVSCIIEGNTDSIAYPQDILLDNWDLSVKRATAIVRSLQNDYNISPRRLTASGHGEYMSISPNETPEGRAANRRIRAVIVPPTDQLLRLLEHKKGQEDEEVPNAAPPAPPVAPAPAKDSTVTKDSAVAAHVDSSTTSHKDSTITTPVITTDTTAAHVDSSTTPHKDSTITTRSDTTIIPKDSVLPVIDTTKHDSTHTDTTTTALATIRSSPNPTFPSPARIPNDIPTTAAILTRTPTRSANSSPDSPPPPAPPAS